MDNIHRVPPFLKSVQRKCIDESQQPITSQQHELSGKKIVFSGIRDKILTQKLATYGIKVSEQVSKDVVCLIVKDKTDVTSKMEKAKKYNIPILTIDEFKL